MIVRREGQITISWSREITSYIGSVGSTTKYTKQVGSVGSTTEHTE